MSDEDQMKRICEILDALKDPSLPAEEAERLERELDRYVYVRDPRAVGVVLPTPPVKLEWIAFAEQLKNRQGSKLPDFDALYKKKTDFDRRLGGAS